MTSERHQKEPTWSRAWAVLRALMPALSVAILLTIVGACDDAGSVEVDVTSADLPWGDQPGDDDDLEESEEADAVLEDDSHYEGACINPGDQSIVHGETAVDVDSEVASCGFSVLSSGTPPTDGKFATMVAECLAGASGVSGACAECYGVNAYCGANNCLVLCIGDPTAPECVDCRCGRGDTPDCIGEFNHCSGLADPTCD